MKALLSVAPLGCSPSTRAMWTTSSLGLRVFSQRARRNAGWSTRARSVVGMSLPERR